MSPLRSLFPRYRRSRAFLPAALLLAGSMGCGDDPLPSEPRPSSTPSYAVFEGRLVDPLGVAGLDSVRIALLELGGLRFEGQALSGALGYFRIDGLPAGDYVPVIETGDAVLLGLPQPSYPLAEGDTVRVELSASRRPAEEAQVSGRVVDAQSGAAIADALVEMGTTAGAAEIFGFTTRNRQLSDLEGRFALSDILIIKSDPNEPGLVPDLLVSAPGYRSLRRPFSELDLPALDLRLELEPGLDASVLEGRVVGLEGAPLSGVPLALEWVSRPESAFKGGEEPPQDQVLLLGHTALSGSDGGYRFEGLPSGFYQVLTGYRRDDGWLRVDGPSLPDGLVRPRVTIPDSGQVELGPIAAAPAVVPILPISGTVVGPQPDFEWQEWPLMGTRWATGYRLVIAPAGAISSNEWTVFAPITGTRMEWPSPDTRLRVGRYAWRIELIGGLAQGLSVFESWAEFEVPEPESGISGPPPSDPPNLRLSTDRLVTPPGAGASGSLDGR